MSTIKHRLTALLRASERYTKTDMVYLTKNGFWLTVGQFAASGGALVLAVLFANLLPKDVYGTYRYVLSVVSILGIATLSGINTTLGQGVARGHEGSFLPALTTKIRYGLVGGVVSLVLAGYYYTLHNTTLALAFTISAVFLPLMDPLSLFYVYLQSKKLFRESTSYFIQTQLTATLTMAVALFLTDNLALILLAYFLPWTLTRYFFYRSALKRFPPNSSHDPDIISRGKHISAVGVLSSMGSYFDGPIIFHFLGAIPLALYGIAIAPVAQLGALFLKNIPVLSIPRLASRSFREINHLLYRRMVVLALIGIVVGIVYALSAPYFFTLLFPKYMEAVAYSQWYVFIIAFQLPASFFNAVQQSKISFFPKKWLYWGAVPDAALVLSLLVFVPLIGLPGVIVSKFIEQIMGFAVGLSQWILISRRESLSTI